jgi:hypothetical protein
MDFHDTWRRELDTNTVGDIYLSKEDRFFQNSDIEQYIHNKLVVRNGCVITGQHLPIPIDKLTDQWQSFSRDLPAEVLSQIRRGPTPLENRKYSRQARELIETMGWDGSSGLGPREDGITTPIVATSAKFRGSHLNKRPLDCPINFQIASHVTLDKTPATNFTSSAPTTNPRKPTRLEAFLVDGKWKLGWKRVIDNKTYYIQATLSTRGVPRPTNVKYKVNPRLESMPTVSWGGGIVGPAEFTYPHPKGWTFNNSGIPLDELTVKTITNIYTSMKQVPPSCIAAWENLLGPIRWEAVAVKYHSKILTPRDWASHFKLILHRALFTRTINPKAPSNSCRCCHRERERIVHLARCSKLEEVWRCFDRVSRTPANQITPTYRLFGVRNDTPLPLALLDLHTVTWKYILLAMVQVDLDNLPFNPASIWKQALVRYARAAHATAYLAQTIIHINRCRGDSTSTAPIKHLRKHLFPLAQLDSLGRLHWTKAMRAEFKRYEVAIHSSTHDEPTTSPSH